jgi:hypothetical protein
MVGEAIQKTLHTDGVLKSAQSAKFGGGKHRSNGVLEAIT